jgi:hypothetical protein
VAAKAGTTSLWFYLEQHPEIYMSPTKEPHYFSQIHPDPKLAMFYPHVADETAYLALFDGATSEKVIGEASTSYLWDAEVPGRIKSVAPDASIIIMLRDPVARAYSHYWNDAAEGFETRTFLEAVEEDMVRPVRGWGFSPLYVHAGLYSESIERYRDLFGERVMIILFEEFVDDVRGHMRSVFRFLKVDPEFAEAIELEPQNVFKVPRNTLARQLLGAFGLRRKARAVLPQRLHPPMRNLLVKRGAKPGMEPEASALLAQFYRADIERVRALLGRALPW